MGVRAQRIAPAIPISKYANVQAFTPSPAAKRIPLNPAPAAEARQKRKVDQANRMMDKEESASAKLAAQIKALQRR
jgi:hypothetical protein